MEEGPTKAEVEGFDVDMSLEVRDEVVDAIADEDVGGVVDIAVAETVLVESSEAAISSSILRT